ncbi:hypothetical protein AWJ20_3457 [Sugiyamaella lignohabitans]|uniref:Uncharacterized protein n=1 Tax=Sugiyamaella lignohabitans TaxID=796027 RepID=A0A167FX47_9ASCO|nr:uncharacterized protein AWJ20_3457 [Sugiyamaella lignohabitans]ANB15813.1 hypothetical protein AWJ20_3457 [Sugiyamaella lignohabitans]
MYRKSTNPFIDDRSDDSFDEDDESNILFPKQQARPPQRPPTSSKPAAVVTTRQRRSNSDSSLMEPPVKPVSDGRHKSDQRDTTPHRSGDRDHDHHHRSSNREHREHRSHRDKSDRERSSRKGTKSSSSKEHTSSKTGGRKKGQPLDVIDKLDVTGLFGPGSFHHDGPFDACTPHRNKNTKRAPVMAFPADGANNSISGVDPNRDKYATENTIMGRGVDEAYLDYNISSSARNRLNNGLSARRPSPETDESKRVFNPGVKEEPVHGDFSMGLGSSTFLEGAPASREAIKQSVEEQQSAVANGLGRKKSLVQRLRGNSNSGPLPVPPRPHRYNSASGPSSSNPELAGSTDGPVSRTSSHPNPIDSRGAGSSGSSPKYVTTTSEDYVRSSEESNPKSPPAITVQLASGSANSGSSNGGGGNGLLRRVKSLKVGSRRRGS